MDADRQLCLAVLHQPVVKLYGPARHLAALESQADLGFDHGVELARNQRSPDPLLYQKGAVRRYLHQSIESDVETLVHKNDLFFVHLYVLLVSTC